MSGLVADVVAERRLPSPGLARAIRQSAGVSQARIAHELGVHPVSVARWEAGTRTPRGELRRRYAGLLAELQQVSA